jgi:SAM-dependent methyltransferase
MIKKPLLLSKSFFPDRNANKMKSVDDVVASRENFLKNKPNNLNFLLEKRYLWMNDWIKKNDIGIEVGCGNGLSALYIKSSNFTLTDNTNYSWVAVKVDALNMPYSNGSLDFIVSSNMIHHLAHPGIFFKECYRVLKPGGLIIIQEINASFFMRLVIRIMKHEGYNYDIDPFNDKIICNDPIDLWSGNNVIPNILFDDHIKFETHFHFSFVKKKYTEFIIFLISGGVTAKTKTVNLPRFLLEILHIIDNVLIFISKGIFALQHQVVLRKNYDD